MNTQRNSNAHEDLQKLTQENAVLRQQMTALTRELRSMRPVVEAAKKMRTWDHNPYDVTPGDGWISLDRESAARIMQALAGVDHWEPWANTIAPRPQS